MLETAEIAGDTVSSSLRWLMSSRRLGDAAAPTTLDEALEAAVPGRRSRRSTIR